MVKLLEEDTGEDLIHQVFPSSNVHSIFIGDKPSRDDSFSAVFEMEQ